MRSFRLTADDAGPLADAARHLAARSGDRPLGMTAISFAAGPAVLSLFETDAVDFVVLVGGYYDIAAAITFVTTGFYREDAGSPWRHRTPTGLATWAFLLSNADRLDDAGDRAALAEMARRKIKDPDADISDLVAGLGPEGRAVYALFANRDPDKAAALIAALPPAVRTEIEALDLKRRDLSGLDARFVLVHGRQDPVIPATESMALAAALGPGVADLYLVDELGHVDAADPDLSDSVTLLRAVYRVLEMRDDE